MPDEYDDLREDIEEAVKSEAIEARERFERNLSTVGNVWGHSELGLEAKKAAMSMLSTKTGMYARIPLTCKGESCPYSDHCPLLEYNLTPVGEACPMETAQIEKEYVEYCDEFGLDDSSFTDRNMVSEIINLDVMINRAKALIAKDGNPIIDVITGVSESGVEFTHPEIAKSVDLYERLTKRRENIYQLMMATRRDKKDQGVQTEKSFSQVVAEIQNGEGFVIEKRPDTLPEN